MKIPRIFGLGAGLGVVSWALGGLYRMVLLPSGGIATTTFSIPKIPLLPLNINVQQQITSGVNTDLASKLLQTLGGGAIPPLMGLTIALVAGIIVAFVGKFVVDAIKASKLPLPVGNKPLGKITAVMVYGTLISTIVATFIGGKGVVAIPAVGFVIASVIYYLIVGWVYAAIRGLGLKMLPEPE